MATTPEIASEIAILRAAAERTWCHVNDRRTVRDLLVLDRQIRHLAEYPDAEARLLWRDWRLFGVATWAKHAVNLAKEAPAHLRPILEEMYDPDDVDELLPHAMRALSDWDGACPPTAAVETACGKHNRSPREFSDAVKALLRNGQKHPSRQQVERAINALSGDARAYAEHVYREGRKSQLEGRRFQKAKAEAERQLCERIPELMKV